MEHPASQGRRPDAQAVVGLGDVTAECRELRGQRGEPVGLVASEVGDAPDLRRAVGEAEQRRDHGGELAHRVQVEHRARHRAAAGDGETVGVEHRLAAQFAHEASQPVSRLRRLGGPARDADPAACQQGRDDEGCGARQVGLHGVDVQRERGGRHVELRPVALGSGAEPAQHVQRHRDVRLARGPALQPDRDAALERRCGQQQGGEELAGRRRVEFHGPALQAAVSSDRERNRSAAVVVDVGAERAQCAQEWGDGPAPDGGVAVEVDGAGAERGQRRSEPGDRPGVAERYPDLAVTGGHRSHPHAVRGLGRRGAEDVERPQHQPCVAGVQRLAHKRLAGRQSGEHEGAVGDRLGTGNPDVGVDLVGGRRRGPGVLLAHAITVPHVRGGPRRAAARHERPRVR